jgi:hypothetical protein
MLLRGLASDVAEVRRLALVTLPALAPGDGAVLDRVRAAAVREGAALRDEGLAAIGQSGGTGKAILLTALESDDGSTNAALLRAVEPVMSARERLALCRRLLASPDAGARWLAVTSLAALSPEEPAAASELATAVERERDPAVREAAFLALVEAAPQAAGDMDAAVLAPLLHARLWSARVEARRLLEALGDPRDVVVPALLDALDVGDSYAREEAMTHLARLGAPPEAAPKAARCLVEDTRQGLCVAAAALLGSMGADAAPAATTLADIAVGGDAYAASHALRALAAIGPPARDALPRLEAHVKITHNAPELLQAIASISAEVEPARGGTLP